MTVKAEEEKEQCNAICKNGKRCSKKTAINGYCTQHAKMEID